MISVEYRIGNILNFVNKYQYLLQGEITNVSIDKVVFNHKYPIKHQNLIPIDLTEEWLLKFGFDVVDDGCCRRGYFYWYSKLNNLYLEFNSTVTGSYDFLTDCIYVHQLQNLYFALTGEELSLQNNQDSLI